MIFRGLLSLKIPKTTSTRDEFKDCAPHLILLGFMSRKIANVKK